ncbi:LOW QUALITY PROTEIN: hypothetical protein HZS_701 [Henneguya salminicola]|nr:LOW QUALITY PROTEIN: hypothetical protein HZS_701 [Henneguya salminicola]
MLDSNESIMYSSQEETTATVQNTEHMHNRERKQIISLDQRYLIPMVAKNENKDSIISVTGLSRSTVYKVAKFIEENELNATYMPYYNKPGRKLTDNTELINSIKDGITIENSYTQVSIKTQLQNINFLVSRSKICKVMKQADITRKRLKKKVSITLSQDHQQTRSRYASLFLSKRGRTFLFLDESGFNLHTSINYAYSDKNVDAVSFVPPNRGRNVSTCCVISATRLENFEFIIGPFNKERFLTFLLKCFNERH